jgi:ABC-type glutathione transport system ATPase component
MAECDPSRRHERRASPFPSPAAGELLVLDGVNLTLREGEIVGLLGRSGSGKSTLLRLIAGLIRADRGEVTYLRPADRRAGAGIAMVFQSFALFPWLTVLRERQLGLEALRLPERRSAAGAGGDRPDRPRRLRAPIRASSPAACASASASPARWWCIPTSC